MSKLFIYTVGIGVFLLTNFAVAATTEVWKHDVRAIVHNILAIHPGPFDKVGKLTWKRKADDLQQMLPQLSEPERVVRLMQLVARIGDGHTQIELDGEEYDLWYPFRIYEFSDGYYVTSAHKSIRDLAGAEVISIAGRPAADVINSARTLMGASNEFDSKERLYAVHNAYLMQGLGYAQADGSLNVTFRRRNGAETNRLLKPHRADEDYYPHGVPIFEWRYPSEVYGLPFGDREEWITAYGELPSNDFQELDETRPLFLQHRTTYTRRSLPNHNAYYVQFNQTDDSGMVGYMAEAFEEIDEQKPTRLIIDIRLNFGGDGSTVGPMIRQFIARAKNKPWDELYLITGRKTYSAAMAIIDAFIDHTDVTLVGEPAGSPQNFYGDTERIFYPALGLRLEVSALRHQGGDSADLRPFVPVDVPAPMTFADYVNGRDSAVDPIIAGEEMRSIPTVALQEGGAEARRVHLDREERFANLSWYRAPEEIALRRVMGELINRGRNVDAIEVATLNSEIHPYIWNTWYNLAAAQNAAGPPHSEKRYASYKCVVLLAPTNWNVPSILELYQSEKVDPKPAPGCPIGE